MKHKLPRYCNVERNRHGTVYIRFRRRGFSHYFKAALGTPEFDAEYAQCLSGTVTYTSERHVKGGTVAALVAQYYKAPEYRKLADTTKRTYGNVLNRFVDKHGDKRVKQLERRHVKAIIGGMSETPQAANNLLKLLRIILDLACDIGMIDVNPAQNVKGYPTKTPGFHTWSDREIEQFKGIHPEGSKARLAFMLLLHTAQRRGDVVRMGRQHVQEGRLRITQSKTGMDINIPIHPELAAELDRHGINMTFLLTSHGKPFTSAGFGNWFRDRCNEAGLRHCSAHGLRKAQSRILAESGKSTNQIGAVTGHKSLKEIDRYTRAADRAQLADSAFDVDEWTESEQKLPTLSNRAGKKAEK